MESFYAVYIYRVSLETVNGISSTKDISATAVSLQAGDIECIKFVEEDNALMLLWRDAGTSMPADNGRRSSD
jgi:anaphase-promoting complex subunit 4